MGKLLRTLFWLLAAIIGAVLLAVATVDSWLVIGERSQGGYEPPTADEKVAAEEHAQKAIAAALEAARDVEALGKDGDARREEP